MLRTVKQFSELSPGDHTHLLRIDGVFLALVGDVDPEFIFWEYRIFDQLFQILKAGFKVFVEREKSYQRVILLHLQFQVRAEKIDAVAELVRAVRTGAAFEKAIGAG